MKYTLMAIWIFVAFTLPRLIHGRPAIDGRSVLNMLTARASKLADFSEQKAISSFAQGNPAPTKLRAKRSSDHRLSELKTLMSMSKINCKRSPLTPTGLERRQLDPVKIGRRRRFATIEAMPHIDGPKQNVDPTYPLIS